MAHRDHVRPVYGVLGVLVVLGAANFLWTAADLAPYPYDLDYSEGFALEDTRRLQETGTLYLEPTLENGFESVKYPPLYYVVHSGLVSLFGVSFTPGRVLNVVLMLFAALLLYAIARERTDAPLVAAPLLFLVPYPVLYAGITIRPDVLALVASLTGLLFFLRDRLEVSAIFFLIAVFTKQTYVAGFLAVSVVLWARQDWRVVRDLLARRDVHAVYREYQRPLRFITIYGVGAVMGAAALFAWSPHVFTNVLTANLGGFAVRQDIIGTLISMFLPVFAIAVYYCLRERDVLIGTYLATSAGIAGVQLVRGGAWVHVAIEVFAITVICAAILASRTDIRRYVVAGLLVQTAVFLWAPALPGTVLDIGEMDDRNAGADAHIMQRVENAQGRVYTENAGYLLHDDRPAPPEIWGLYEQYTRGAVSAEEVRSFFRQRNYTWIITYARWERLPIQELLREQYRRTSTDGLVRHDAALSTWPWRIYRRTRETG